MKIKTAVIIPAAGTGKRMGGTHKQFRELGGVPVIVHTLKKFQQSDYIDAIYLVVSTEKMEFCRKEIVNKFGLTKVKEVIEGGKERQDSVYNGLTNGKEFDVIMIHDAVRPFLSGDMIGNSIEVAVKFGAVVVAIPEKDTVKEVNDRGVIIKTLDRTKLCRIQTPQTFKREILEKAFQMAFEQKFSGTDESSLVEWAGFEVRIIPGSEFNIKLTTKEDMELAEFLISNGF